MHQELHWLDIQERVNYRLGVLTHWCLLGKVPVYLSNCCIPVSQVATRRHLRSAARHQLTVPRHRLSMVRGHLLSLVQIIYEILRSINVLTDLLKALSLHQFCSTCIPTTCQLHVAENSFMVTTYVSPFKANTSANWNAVSRQIWRRCHTSVNSGNLSQVPPKQ